MKRILLVALVACSSHANAPKQPTGWYCAAGDEPACTRTEKECGAACQRAEVAYCFDATGEDGTTSTKCFGSPDVCRESHDVDAMSSASLTDCESTP